MTQKFIPFDPNTAKNGDILHYAERTEWTFIYIGPCPNNKNASVVFDPRDNTYGFNYNDSMVVPQPMKTVWVNIVKYGLCGLESSVFDDEKMAKGMSSKYAGEYLGTFPVEIPA